MLGKLEGSKQVYKAVSGKMKTQTWKNFAVVLSTRARYEVLRCLTQLFMAGERSWEPLCVSSSVSPWETQASAISAVSQEVMVLELPSYSKILMLGHL